MKGPLICFAIVGLWFAPCAGRAQSSNVRDLAAGKILVAGRDLADPNFAHTVVLLVEYSRDGVMGLVVNRRTTVPLSRIFDDAKAAGKRTDPVYAGGPVERTSVLALLRAHDRPEAAKRVFGDVHLVSTKELLDRTLASGAGASTFRVYLGYAGWAPAQLEREVLLGAWFIFRGDAAVIFERDPGTVWSRLIEQTELGIARLEHLLPVRRYDEGSAAYGDPGHLEGSVPTMPAGGYLPHLATARMAQDASRVSGVRP